jgi:dTDP-D-glucose 4,6-dehydratase
MNCDKIKHELIWETKNSIKEGLEKTINYYINEEQNNNFFISKNQ